MKNRSRRCASSETFSFVSPTNYFSLTSGNHLCKTTYSMKQALELENLISSCNKKIAINEFHQKALYIRANALLKQDKFQECIEDCEKLLSIDPSNTGALYMRGSAYERLGQIDQGLIDFEKVMKIDPTNVNAAYARGSCENRRGNLEEAIKLYHIALEKDSARMHKFPEEISQSSPDPSASSSIKDRAELFHCKGFEFRKTGDLTKAIEYYSQSLRLFTENFRVWFNRGYAFHLMGEYCQAIKDYFYYIYY